MFAHSSTVFLRRELNEGGGPLARGDIPTNKNRSVITSQPKADKQAADRRSNLLRPEDCVNRLPARTMTILLSLRGGGADDAVSVSGIEITSVAKFIRLGRTPSSSKHKKLKKGENEYD